MSFVDESETFSRIARITGPVTPDDTRRLVDEGYEGILLDHESVEAASSLRWMTDVPALRFIELRGRIVTPSLAVLEETSVRSLIVRTNQARPVPTEDLRWATHIHSESSDFAADGWVSLSRMENLVLGRVGGDVITAGDGCSALTQLKLQGKRQTAAFRWQTPPKKLEWMLLLNLRSREIAALSGCRALRSLHIENPPSSSVETSSTSRRWPISPCWTAWESPRTFRWRECRVCSGVRRRSAGCRWRRGTMTVIRRTRACGSSSSAPRRDGAVGGLVARAGGAAAAGADSFDFHESFGGCGDGADCGRRDSSRRMRPRHRGEVPRDRSGRRRLRGVLRVSAGGRAGPDRAVDDR